MSEMTKTTDSSKRAPKGGTIGKNGEHYKGGTFLPSTTLPKQGSQAKKAKTGKQEVAPYVWEMQPSADHKALYDAFRSLVKWDNGQPGDLLTAYLDHKGYTAEERAQIVKARDLWLAGQRWHLPGEL